MITPESCCRGYENEECGKRNGKSRTTARYYRNATLEGLAGENLLIIAGSRCSGRESDKQNTEINKVKHFGYSLSNFLLSGKTRQLFIDFNN